MTAIDAYTDAHRMLGRPNRRRSMGVVLHFAEAFGEAHILIGRARNGLKIDAPEVIAGSLEREAIAAAEVAYVEPEAPVMNKRQKAREAEAQKLLASRKRGDRDRGAAMLRLLGRELGRQMESREADARLDHAVRLARVRGEEVEETREFGGGRKLRVKSRDGLTSLYHEGSLTGLSAKEQASACLKVDGWARASLRLQAGLRYRSLFEMNGRELRSQLDDSPRGSRPEARIGTLIGGVDIEIDGAHLGRIGQMQKADELQEIEENVAALDKRGLALRALRAVAGEARTVASLAASGGARRVLLKRLIAALDTVALYERMPGAVGLLTERGN